MSSRGSRRLWLRSGVAVAASVLALASSGALVAASVVGTAGSGTVTSLMDHGNGNGNSDGNGNLGDTNPTDLPVLNPVAPLPKGKHKKGGGNPTPAPVAAKPPKPADGKPAEHAQQPSRPATSQGSAHGAAKAAPAPTAKVVVDTSDPAPFAAEAVTDAARVLPVERLGPLSGISFGSGLFIWPLLVTVDVLALAVIARVALRRRLASPED